MEYKPLTVYIDIGKNVQFLLEDRTNTPYEQILTCVDNMFDLLDKVDLPITKRTAGQLREVVAWARKRNSTGFIDKNASQLISNAADAIRRTYEGEIENRQAVVLDFNAISERLKEFPSNGSLTNIQEHLKEETSLCLECGAYRAAIVMGWNLAFDYVRWWVWDDQQRQVKLHDFYRRKSMGPSMNTMISSAGKNGTC